MSEELASTAKQVAGDLINMSALLDEKLERWSHASQRPYNLSPTECVGFINKEIATSGLNFVVDVQAPDDKKETVLRIWCIESSLDDDQTDRYNNIQLNFIVNYDQAREITKKVAEATRDDIKTLLQSPDTKLARVVVSNKSGLNKSTQQTLGERYELNLDEARDNKELIDKISAALRTVQSTLKNSATTEAE